LQNDSFYIADIAFIMPNLEPSEKGSAYTEMYSWPRKFDKSLIKSRRHSFDWKHDIKFYKRSIECYINVNNVVASHSLMFE